MSNINRGASCALKKRKGSIGDSRSGLFSFGSHVPAYHTHAHLRNQVAGAGTEGVGPNPYGRTPMLFIQLDNDTEIQVGFFIGEGEEEIEAVTH